MMGAHGQVIYSHGRSPMSTALESMYGKSCFNKTKRHRKRREDELRGSAWLRVRLITSWVLIRAKVTQFVGERFARNAPKFITIESHLLVHSPANVGVCVVFMTFSAFE